MVCRWVSRWVGWSVSRVGGSRLVSKFVSHFFGQPVSLLLVYVPWVLCLLFLVIVPSNECLSSDRDSDSRGGFGDLETVLRRLIP